MPKTTHTAKKTAGKPSNQSTTRGTKKKGTKKASPKAPAKKRQKKVYPAIEVEKRLGKDALTAEEAKKLIGWEEETEEKKFGKDYLFTKSDGTKVRTTLNTTNRGFEYSLAVKYRQEHLRRKWHVNGQSLIFGEYGNCLSAQHRLIGFILAVEEWKANKDKYPEWKTEPKMECLIVCGISETDEVVNTIDTGKPRTLSDVLYRSVYFHDHTPKERKELSRICEYAIRIVWDRSGAKDNAYCPNLFRTHSEAIDFLDRHDKLLKAVSHVHSEGKELQPIVRNLGDTAGLLYLMAASSTDPSKYNEGTPPNEELIDLDRWDMAEDFFVELHGSDKLDAVKKALDKIESSEDTILSNAARKAVIIKAWNLYVGGEDNITPSDLKLNWTENEDGEKILDDFPTVGGIDFGKSWEPVIEDEPDEEEIEERKTRLRKSKNGKTPGKEFQIGDEVFVVEKEGTPWKGKLTENPKGSKALVKVAQGFAGAGSVYEVDYDSLTDKDPAG